MEQIVRYNFNPTFHAIKFLSLEQKFWPEIDKLFRDLRPTSLTAARKHQGDGGFIISTLPHRERLRAVELIGIDNVDHAACNNLMLKMFRREMIWISAHHENLNFNEYMREFAKKNTTNEYERLFLVFHMVATQNNLKFDRENEAYNGILVRIDKTYNRRLEKPALAAKDAWTKDEIKNLQEEWFSWYKDASCVSDLQFIKDLYGSKEEFFEAAMLEEGCYLANFEDIRFSKSEIKKLISDYCITSRNNPTFEGLQKNISAAMIVKSLARTSALATNDFINLSLTAETEKATTYKRELKELKQKFADASTLAAQRQEALNKTGPEIDRLKKSLADMGAENNNLRAELDAMRAALNEPDENPGQEKLLKFPDGKKIVVLGGSPNWQKKIAAAFPAVTIIAPENFNFDPAIIKNADLICFNWLFASHAQYYRLINSADKSKIVYIANNNLDVFLATVAKND